MRPATLVAWALVLAVAGAGCGTLTGRSAERWIDDRALTAKVKTRLASASLNTLTRVNVDTYEGVVYLFGVVDSEPTKRRLEEIARTVPEVEQVVTNLTVRGPAGAASPATDPAARRPHTTTHPLLAHLPGLSRIEGDGIARPRGPWLAYDAAGRLVATIYSITMADLAQYGLEGLRPAGGAVDHVSIHPLSAHPDAPRPYYHVVLWHVSPAEAAALR